MSSRIPAVVTSTTKLINPNSNSTGGFHCTACDATFTAYDAYMDHCNSRVHLKNTGEAPVERVEDVERIRARLQLLRDRKVAREGGRRRMETDAVNMIEERIRSREVEAEDKRKLKYTKKKEKSKNKPATTNDEDDEETKLMASMLGITGFK